MLLDNFDTIVKNLRLNPLPWTVQVSSSKLPGIESRECEIREGRKSQHQKWSEPIAFKKMIEIHPRGIPA